jgi:protocatechuate 3,4-dioxygenase beta subunit
LTPDNDKQGQPLESIDEAPESVYERIWRGDREGKDDPMTHDKTRRQMLISGALASAGWGWTADALSQGELPPTPACNDGDPPTVRQTEGPFFKPSSPQRSDLREPGMRGQPVELAGAVLTRSCRPVAGALLDLWQADHEGEYDNSGFRLRGHQYADAEGRYRFSTIVPGLYPGRTRHFHIKVQPPGGRVLTTQLYFPGEPQNRADGLFRRDLLLRVAKAEGSLAARFDFVLDMR